MSAPSSGRPAPKGGGARGARLVASLLSPRALRACGLALSLAIAVVGLGAGCGAEGEPAAGGRGEQDGGSADGGRDATQRDAQVTSDGARAPQDASSSDGQVADAGPAQPDSSADAASDQGAPQGPDRAWVFPVDPVATPEPVLVTLDGVADDAGGALVSARRPDGVRKLQVLSCVDEGQLGPAPAGGQQRVCTLRSRANKDAHGDFAYADWETSAAGGDDPDDVFAEVSLYYHAERFYSFVTSPSVGLFELLPGRHWSGDRPVPLTLVANYRLPTPAGSQALDPATVAFFLPAEMAAAGMAAVQGLVGVPGDVLVFGQGAAMDFAYDGQTIYHELGHAVVHALADLPPVMADRQGLSHLGGALNEGIADTFAALVSGQPRLFAYLDQRSGGGFGRRADNSMHFPGALRGLSVRDGQIVSGACWALSLWLQEHTGLGPDDLTRALLVTLQRLPRGQPLSSLAGWAELLLEALVEQGAAEHEEALRALLSERGLLDRERVLDGCALAGGPEDFLYVPSAGPEPWNVTLRVDRDGEELRLAPAHVQLRAAAPADGSPLVLGATLVRMPGTPAGAARPRAELLVRRAEPLAWAPVDATRASVEYDSAHEPGLGEGPGQRVVWEIGDLEPGARYYLQVIGRGDAAGFLTGLSCDCGDGEAGEAGEPE